MTYDPQRDPNHVHRYQFHSLKSVFEELGAHGETVFDTHLYVKVDYALLFCNCGHTIRTLIEDRDTLPTEDKMSPRNP